MRFRFVFVFFMLFQQFVYSQANNEYVKLILSSNQKDFKLLNENLSQYGKLQILDAEFGLYTLLVKADFAETTMQKIRALPSMRFVQKNHTLSRRYDANDPLIANQKHLNVIRSFQAWDYGRGGTNRRGDTIVVAVIDDGVDTMHPDLIENLWFNRGEIPNNGADDDFNGYTDDYRGWNGGDSNHIVFTNQSLTGHGTGVAGVIGASGDNMLGISGVNWNVKIMPVVCYSTNGLGGEDGVIRSMLYVLRMKRLFVKSGGTKGANIAAINMSVGIDLATPDDAPVWCALYDSLGAAGIISVAATTNLNINVDNKDIPSTCPSKYLLIVNNTDQNDQRVNSGFSKINVDLAAPGQNVYTTALKTFNGPNGPYTEESGTSFASPQVAGAVALLHNTVCITWLNLLESNHDSAIALMNGWILNGADKLPALKDRCASEGRLNLLSAWIQMDNWCKLNDVPYSVSGNQFGNIAVFPNPIKAGGQITLQNIHFNGEKIQLLSMDGKTMNLPVKPVQNGEITVELPLVSPGIYSVIIYNSGKSLVQKLSVY